MLIIHFGPWILCNLANVEIDVAKVKEVDRPAGKTQVSIPTSLEMLEIGNALDAQGCSASQDFGSQSVKSAKPKTPKRRKRMQSNSDAGMDLDFMDGLDE